MKKLLLILLAATGCAHVDTVNETEFKTINPKAIGVLTTFTLKNSDSCTLNLRRPGGHTDFPVDVTEGKHSVFVELPPGIYLYNDLYCGTSRDWDLRFHKWPEFIVRENEITFVTPVNFDIESNLLTAHILGEQATTSELTNASKKLPQEIAKKVVTE